jgi:hypothetical protein
MVIGSEFHSTRRSPSFLDVLMLCLDRSALQGAAISSMISFLLNMGSVQGGSYLESCGVPMTFKDLLLAHSMASSVLD